MSSISQQANKKRPRQRRQILPEEEYNHHLEGIIQRDYYPDLQQLQQTAALQQRREAGDLVGAVAVRRASRQLQQHEEAVAEQEQFQEEAALQSGGVRAIPRPIQRESLTGFHERVVSNHNAEFEVTQNREVEERREERQRVRYALTNGPCTEKESSLPRAATPFLLASDQFLPPSNQADFSNKEALALMPPPLVNLKVPKDALVEYISQKSLEKKIEPAATRFPPRTMVATYQTRQHFEGSDAGSTTEYSTDASTDLDTPGRLPLDQERFLGMKRKRREQETLVQMTPLIVPGAANGSPVMTWGSVGATPVVLSQATKETLSVPQSAFRLPAESARDDAAATARDRLAVRAKRSRAAGTTPRHLQEANLTPAARALLSTPGRPASVRSGSAFAAALRSSYTPRRSSASASARSSRSRVDQATPRVTKNGETERMGRPVSKQANITDGLLQLPP